MGRPREHDDETRSRILAVAEQLFLAGGVDGVTVRRVAGDAGTTTRAIYTLFGDKEGLMRALFHEAAALMTKRHEEVRPRGDLAAEMVDLALAYRRAALESPQTITLVVPGARGFHPDDDDVRLARRSFDRVVETLGRLAAAGRLGGRSVEQAGTQMWGLVHGLAMLELQGALGSSTDADRLWRDAVLTMIRGFERPPS